MNLTFRRPAEPTVPASDSDIYRENARLTIECARLQADIEHIRSHRDAIITDLRLELAAARAGHRAAILQHQRDMADRVLVDDLPASDIRRRWAQERRNNNALAAENADLRNGTTKIRQGGHR